MYQRSVGIGGTATTATTGGSMGIAVCCCVGIAVCGYTPIVVGVGEHQALAKVLSQGPVCHGPEVGVQGVPSAHSSLGHQACQFHTEEKETKTIYQFIFYL